MVWPFTEGQTPQTSCITSYHRSYLQLLPPFRLYQRLVNRGYKQVKCLCRAGDSVSISGLQPIQKTVAEQELQALRLVAGSQKRRSTAAVRALRVIRELRQS